VAFHEKAEQRLKTGHPELARALMEQRQVEQQKTALAAAKAAADKVADKAVSDFKALAAKREGKFFGCGDSGKQWGALPDELKATIESFNKQPATARSMELERMRENFKRTPGAAEKLTKQLEQGKVRGVVR
jgi:NADPH:quinone reductase-like Zn-dependent oxidoreductase